MRISVHHVTRIIVSNRKQLGKDGTWTADLDIAVEGGPMLHVDLFAKSEAALTPVIALEGPLDDVPLLITNDHVYFSHP